MDRTWMSLGRCLDNLETGGSHGTRTKRELPANDRDPAGNLSAGLGQSSTACNSQLPCTDGFSWMSMWISGGAIGVWLKLKGPWSCTQADRFEFRWDPHSRFKVSSTCRMNQSQTKIEKTLPTLYRLAMKWFFNVLITLSAAFWQWRLSGTGNWWIQWLHSLGGLMKLHCPGIATAVEV